MNETQMEACARAAHEANRAYCLVLGDDSQTSWENAPEWQRTSAVNGVRGVLAGNNPEQSHESWLAEKAATGWKYGPVKDPEKKEHPCFLPYAELPAAQRAKDHVFTGVVRAMAEALGLPIAALK
jgi:RyR domain